MPASPRRAYRSSEEAFVSAPYLILTAPDIGQKDQDKYKRYRREKSLCEESGFASLEGLTIEDYRVGGPVLTSVDSVTCVFRPEWGEIHDTHILDLQSTFRAQIAEVFVAHGFHVQPENLRLSLMALSERHKTEDDDNGPTYVMYIDISTCYNGKVIERWVKAADEIYRLAKEIHPQVNIEITNSKKAYIRKETRLLSASDPCAESWPEIEPLVLEALKPETEWRAIHLVVRGKQTGEPEDAFTPTIMITVGPGTNLNGRWKKARNRVLNALEGKPVFANRIAVEFLEGGMALLNTPGGQVGDQFWGDNVYVGASIGIPASTGSHKETSGTLGCFLALHWADGRSATLGLSNWHVCGPHPPTFTGSRQLLETFSEDMRKIHEEGFPIGETCYPLSCPSPIDIAKGLEELSNTGKVHEEDMKLFMKRNIDFEEYLLPLSLEAETSEPHPLVPKGVLVSYRSRLSAIQEAQSAFTAAQHRSANSTAGVTVSGSGYSVIQYNLSGISRPFVMDWALIDIDSGRRDPLGLNKLHGKLTSLSLLGSRDPGIPDEKVSKIGRSTGLTSGFTNRIASTHLLGCQVEGDGADRRVTYVTGSTLLITQKDQNGRDGGLPGQAVFSAAGDSGSAVFGENFVFLGLLLGGVNGTDCRDGTYFIPAGALFESIKLRTGAAKVGLPTERELD